MINGLTINPEVRVTHRNTFVVEYEFMFGDGDNYATRSLPLNEAEVILAKNLFDHGKWDRNYGYSRDPLYKKLGETLIEDDMLELFTEDPDGWGYGRFYRFNTTWYDEQGLPHNVDFV